MSTLVIAMDWSSKQISDLREVQQKQEAVIYRRGSNTVATIENGLYLHKELLKLYVNTLIFSGASSFLVGMVLKNWQRAFFEVKNMRGEGFASGFKVESFGVCEALS